MNARAISYRTILVAGICLSILGAILWFNNGTVEPIPVQPATATQHTAELPASFVDATTTGDWRAELQAALGSVTSSTTDSTAASTSAALDTKTGQVTQALLGTYLQQREANGGTLSSQDVNNIATNIVNQVSGDVGAQHYSVLDLRVSKDSSQDAIRAYGNAMGTAIRTYASPGVTNDELSLLYLVLHGDKSRMQELAIIGQSYQNFVDALTQMNVPQSALGPHLDLLNACAEVQASVEAMQKIFDDPIVGLNGVIAQQRGAQDLVAALTAMTNLMAQNGITFTKDDPGYVLTHQL